jgi:excisionase family DNA binding protein
MSPVLEQHTVLPPAACDVQQVEQLAAVLTDAPSAWNRARLTGPDGTEVALPEQMYAVLRDVAAAMAQGLAVSVAPLHAVVSTQQAAELLTISRPTLIKLLDEGEIPYSQPGQHRRIRLADVLDYQQRTRYQRRGMLDDLSRAASEDGSADEADEFVRTR